MKTLRKIFFIIPLLFIVAASFPSTVDAACSCSCAPKMEISALPGVTKSIAVCSGATDLPQPEQTDSTACQKVCAALPPPNGIGTPPCYIASAEGACVNGSTASCWCNGASGPYHKSDTASETDCKKVCSDLKQDFVAWSNAGGSLPANSIGVKCPPGGIWTEPQCNAAKSEDGTPIGLWKAPAGQTSGPYCFYSNPPIKLGVGLGTLTQANLSQYLAAAYQLGLGIAAALAVIFIMIGGFRYIAAAGGAEVEQGKSMIKNAVIGLVLAALSYTLLQTVNPDLLSLRLPTIQLIKSCDIGPIDCGSRKDKPTCEDNSKDPSKKCSWDPTGSVCNDFSSTQSGNAGQLGGSCKDGCAPITDSTICNADPSGKCSWDGTKCANSIYGGKWTCDAGECVDIDSNNHICSDFGTCQACKNDTTFNDDGTLSVVVKAQCKPVGDLPVMCIDNKCTRINTEKPPAAKSRSLSKDNYILCTGTSGCSSDAQCGTGKCIKGVCKISNQGSDCMALGEDACIDGSKCLSFERPKGLLKVCCADGNKENCLGCNQTDNQIDSSGKKVNSGCPTGMVCSSEARCATAQ